MILDSHIVLSKASDLITLLKPRITALVLATTAAGLWLAPGGGLRLSLVVATLLGTTLLVGAANALNMYIERDVDALMRRTAERPLPAKRLDPKVALWLGLVLAVVSSFVLIVKVNLLTGTLGIIAFVSYVLFYTPLKQMTTAALLVGAVPGALPPLMGWTAATGSLRLPGDLPGLVLFSILFLWQIPHFLAIALFRKSEYEKAGIKILPLEKGDAATKHTIVRYLAGLIAVSFYPVTLGVAGPPYLWVAVFLGLVFFVWGCYGLRPSAGLFWARNLFIVSIIYLPILLFTLALTGRDC